MAQVTLSPAYAAGFFDGEGTVNYRCVYYTKSRLPPSWKRRRNRTTGFYTWSIRLRISNTNKHILDLFQATWGGTVHSCDATNRKGGNRKPLFQWGVASNKAELFARDIFEFSVVKREQLRLFLQFRETIRRMGDTGLSQEVIALRLAIGEQIHALNTRGMIAARPTPLINQR